MAEPYDSTDRSEVVHNLQPQRATVAGLPDPLKLFDRGFLLFYIANHVALMPHGADVAPDKGGISLAFIWRAVLSVMSGPPLRREERMTRPQQPKVTKVSPKGAVVL